MIREQVSRCRWMRASIEFQLLNDDMNEKMKKVVFKFCYIQSLTFQDSEKELSRYFHCDHADHDVFIKSTKFHDYSLSFKVLINMISDIFNRLRLRIASYSVEFYINENDRLCSCRLNKKKHLMKDIKKYFISHEARLWSSNDEKLLCSENDSMQIMWDESVLIYLTKSSLISEILNIMLIDFDSAIKCKELEKWALLKLLFISFALDDRERYYADDVISWVRWFFLRCSLSVLIFINCRYISLNDF